MSKDPVAISFNYHKYFDYYLTQHQLEESVLKQLIRYNMINLRSIIITQIDLSLSFICKYLLNEKYQRKQEDILTQLDVVTYQKYNLLEISNYYNNKSPNSSVESSPNLSQQRKFNRFNSKLVAVEE